LALRLLIPVVAIWIAADLLVSAASMVAAAWVGIALIAALIVAFILLIRGLLRRRL
jgi:hypothetical protein